MTQISKILIGLLITLPLFFSCSKDQLGFGTDYLEDNDFIGANVDSTSTQISFKTVPDNSIRSTKITYMLGSKNDGGLGQSRAEYATRLYFTGLSINLKKFNKIESIRFEMLEKSLYFGENTKPISITLYELKEPITKEQVQAYYENGTVPSCINNKQIILNTTYTPKHIDSSYFQIELPEEFKSSLINKIRSIYSYTDTIDQIDSVLDRVDSLFTKEFHGIYVTTPYEGASIINFQPRIVITVHETIKVNDKDTIVDRELILAPSASAYDVESTKDSTKIYLQPLNMFHHNYPERITETLNAESATNYVQGFMGLKTMVTLSNLDTWKDSVIVFNASRLYVPKKELNTYADTTLQTLNLRIYNKADSLVHNTYSEVNNDTICYSFRMTDFLNHFVDNTDNIADYKIEIVMPNNNTTDQRVYLNTAWIDKIKLKITYTK